MGEALFSARSYPKYELSAARAFDLAELNAACQLFCTQVCASAALDIEAYMPKSAQRPALSASCFLQLWARPQAGTNRSALSGLYVPCSLGAANCSPLRTHCLQSYARPHAERV